MSCDTLNTQAVQLNVSLASLPEGFCPATMQELGNEIAARLIISPSTEFNTFAIGSTAPASNVGPWLKDCLEWFVFDDATASYVPVTKGGFNTIELKSASGSFVVPDFIYKLKIQAWGGGGGGANASANGGGGAGAGGYGMLYANVVPGQSIPFTIGAGGVAGVAGTAGGSTTILGMTCNGGAGGASEPFQGAGGTVTGADVSVNGGSGNRGTSNAGGIGGSAGGGGGDGGKISETAASPFKIGVTPGGGGAGGMSGTDMTAGAGAPGRILIEY